MRAWVCGPESRWVWVDDGCRYYTNADTPLVPSTVVLYNVRNGHPGDPRFIWMPFILVNGLPPNTPPSLRLYVDSVFFNTCVQFPLPLLLGEGVGSTAAGRSLRVRDRWTRRPGTPLHVSLRGHCQWHAWFLHCTGKTRRAVGRGPRGMCSPAGPSSHHMHDASQGLQGLQGVST